MNTLWPFPMEREISQILVDVDEGGAPKKIMMGVNFPLAHGMLFESQVDP